MAQVDPTAQNNTPAAGTPANDGNGQQPAEGTTPPAGGTLVTEPDKPAEGDPVKPAEGDKPEDKSVAPEKYEAFTAPEGQALNEGLVEKFSIMAKEYNLTQEQAQKVVDLSLENAKSLAEKQASDWDKTREGWVTEIKGDQDFGGAKLPETIELAKRTLKEYGSEKLTSFLDSTGYGDNPELIRMLAKMGKTLAEDKTVDGAPSTVKGKSAAEVLYG